VAISFLCSCINKRHANHALSLSRGYRRWVPYSLQYGVVISSVSSYAISLARNKKKNHVKSKELVYSRSDRARNILFSSRDRRWFIDWYRRRASGTDLSKIEIFLYGMIFFTGTLISLTLLIMIYKLDSFIWLIIIYFVTLLSVATRILLTFNLIHTRRFLMLIKGSILFNYEIYRQAYKSTLAGAYILKSFRI
jgi:hypothetical protein